MSSKARRSCLQAAGHAYVWYQVLIEKVGHILFGRFSLILTSLVILAISSDVLLHLYYWVLSPSDDVEVMLRETEGTSTIFLGIGLILKERRLLEKIFGTAPGHENWINNLCLSIGLCLLLNGTAMRIAAQLIRIPDRVLSTAGREQIIFTVGFIFCAIASLLLVYLIFRLLLGHREYPVTAKSDAPCPRSRK